MDDQWGERHKDGPTRGECSKRTVTNNNLKLFSQNASRKWG